MKLNVFLFFALVALAQAATSVSQYGITWTWTANLTVGQYANGDYYVVAPSGITITGITPASTLISGRTSNGSMVDPIAGANVNQGFDSFAAAFSASKNAARPGGNDLSAGNPLVLSAGHSIVSAISLSSNVRPQLSDAAVLTIVSAAPASGSFRPPYCGTDKTHYWNKASLDYSVLRNYASVGGASTQTDVESYFPRPWIEIITEANGRDIHPKNNMPDYGRDMAVRISNVAMWLNLSNTSATKELTMIRYIQYGIDIYGAAVSGGNWRANGGHDMGRKFPMLLAGLALGDSNILAYGNPATHNIFQEDQQTFYVSSTEMLQTPYLGDQRQRSAYGGGTTAPFTSPYTFTATISNASPGVVSATAHGLLRYTPIYFTTTGTLPAPLVANTTYLVSPDVIPATAIATNNFVTIAVVGDTPWHSIGDGNPGSPDIGDFFKATGTGSGTGTAYFTPINSFKLASSVGGTPINTTTVGSGVHTAHFAMLTIPEWGEKHLLTPNRDAANINAYYRDINSKPMTGIVLAARLVTGMQSAWNYPVLFEYTDRIYPLTNPSNFSAFTINMWALYRNPPADPLVSTATINSAGDTLTIVFNVSATNGVGGGNGMTITPSGGAATVAYNIGSGSTTYTYNITGRTIIEGEEITLSYVNPGNGIGATVGGAQLSDFSEILVTNGSTQVAPALLSNGQKQHLMPRAGF